MRPPVEEQDGRRERRPVGGHRRESRRGDGQGDDADLGRGLAAPRRSIRGAPATISRARCPPCPGRRGGARRSRCVSQRFSRSGLKTPSLRALVPTSMARMSRLTGAGPRREERPERRIRGRLSGSSGRRGMPPRNPARFIAAFTPATPWVPEIASLMRLTRSCSGMPLASSPSAARASNSWRASAGNELASDTVPPGEPPIIAGKRKLAEPASTWKDGLSKGRKFSIPLAALSFIPTMFGCAGQAADQLGAERDAAEPRGVVEEERDARAVGERGEVAVEDLVGHLLPEVARGQHQPEVGAQVGRGREEALGLALAVVRGAGDDDLPRRPCGARPRRARAASRLPRGCGSRRSTPAPGSRGARSPRSGARLNRSALVVDVLVLGEGRADRGEHPSDVCLEVVGSRRAPPDVSRSSRGRAPERGHCRQQAGRAQR